MKKSELRQIIREEIKKLYELDALDSNYIQKILKDLSDDIKRDEPKVSKFYMFLKDRINQSFPDGDIERSDLEDLLKLPQGRKLSKNLPGDVDDWLNYIWM